MATRTVILENFFNAASLDMNNFLKEKAKAFKKEGVRDDTEFVGLLLPYLTETNLKRGCRAWVLSELHDFAERPATQKLTVFGINEGKFISIDIPGQGLYIIAYDGENVVMEKKNSFSENKFFERSEKIISKKKKLREAEAEAEREKERKVREAAAAAKREEERVLQRASIKPVKVNLFENDNFFGADEKCPISEMSKKAVNK